MAAGGGLNSDIYIITQQGHDKQNNHSRLLRSTA